VGFTVNGNTGLFTSVDAVSWKLRSSNQAIHSIARSPIDGRLVASGFSSNTYTSKDNGITWQHGSLNILAGYTFVDVEWSSLLNKFVALAQEAANTGIYSSGDGLNWTRIANGAGNRALASSSTLLLNLGGGTDGGAISTSTNGIDWMARSNPATQALNKAIWTGSQFIAVGNAGNIITSPAGTDWIKRDSTVTESLSDVVVAASLLVVTGTKGTILTSENNGITWIKRNSTTNFNLNAVEWTGTELVAIGSNGKSIRSLDGITWTEQPTPYNEVLFGADYYHFNDLVWTDTNGSLLVVGDRGLIVSSP